MTISRPDRGSILATLLAVLAVVAVIVGIGIRSGSTHRSTSPGTGGNVPTATMVRAAAPAAATTAPASTTADSAPSVPLVGATVPGPAGYPPALSGGRLTASVSDFQQGGVDLSAPPSSAGPGVTAGSAYRDCLVDGAGLCSRSIGPKVTLAYATSDVGGRVQADGSVKRVLSNLPVWLFEWDGVPCPLSAGAEIDARLFPSAGPTSPPPTHCVRTMFVNAVNGRYLFVQDSGS
jgi:hypothetical protein